MNKKLESCDIFLFLHPDSIGDVEDKKQFLISQAWDYYIENVFERVCTKQDVKRLEKEVADDVSQDELFKLMKSIDTEFDKHFREAVLQFKQKLLFESLDDWEADFQAKNDQRAKKISGVRTLMRQGKWDDALDMYKNVLDGSKL